MYQLAERTLILLHPIDIASIAELINRQQQDQKALVRALATGCSAFRISKMLLTFFLLEISDEIKGERLRFVDAMKEATAINVQSKVRI